MNRSPSDPPAHEPSELLARPFPFGLQPFLPTTRVPVSIRSSSISQWPFFPKVTKRITDAICISVSDPEN